MPEQAPFPIRTECPPGACDCRRDELLAASGADLRVLRLTGQEEKKLLARIDAIDDYVQLRELEQRLQALLGVRLEITPSANEVRTVRGFHIALLDQPGLCRKTRQAVPAAIRRCLERHPAIAYAILDAGDLLGRA